MARALGSRIWRKKQPSNYRPLLNTHYIMLQPRCHLTKQVQYFEPAKWVAKLRDYKTDDNKLLFKIDMEAGHGGASGRFKRLEDTALNYAFMLDLAGVNK